MQNPIVFPFIREQAAGYDPSILAERVVLLIGAGALANNVALPLTLSGLGELRVCDDDIVEATNVTRSPFFQMMSAVHKPKSKVLAEGFLSLSTASTARSRYAVDTIENLGLGVFHDAGVVVSAVDNFATRAYLARVCRWLRVPLVEAGFHYPVGHVSVFPNTQIDDPCWGCFQEVDPSVSASCTLYSRRVVEQGQIPATQSLAAALGALVAEATIQALHQQFPLAHQRWHININTGESTLVELVRDPDCVIEHEVIERTVDLDVGPDATVRQMLVKIGDAEDDNVLYLPRPFLTEAPCRQCARPVQVNKVLSSITEAPVCGYCSDPQKEAPPVTKKGELTSESRVANRDYLARMKGSKLGLRAGTIVKFVDESSLVTRYGRLSGGVEDLFVTKTKRRAIR